MKAMSVLIFIEFIQQNMLRTKILAKIGFNLS